MELYQYSAYEIVEAIKQKKTTATAVVDAVFKRINEVDPQVQAYLATDLQAAMDMAKKVDQKIAAGHDVGKLAGVPIALKDNICRKGYPLTCASRILQADQGDFKPPYNATVVDKLIAEDAVILGTVNMDEFAMGSSTENSARQVTRNPWDMDCVPGGSSGGSAAAVAAQTAIAALGSDTGGSIRQPASFCGVVGLKPTYGEVSRYGLVAFASSLDQIGPLTKDVRDAALLMDVIAGYDEKDSTSIDASKMYGPYLDYLKKDIAGMTIGIPEESVMEGVDPSVKKAIDEAQELYRSLGAEIRPVPLPHAKYVIAAYYIIATAEASANLARFDGVQYGLRKDPGSGLKDMYLETRSQGFGEEVKRRILLGTYVLSSGYYDAYYKKAQKVRRLIKGDFDKAFASGVDAVMMPTSPTPAFKRGDKTDDPLQMYLSDIFTIAPNLAGIPAMSIPCGQSEQGLPLGLQLVTDADPEQGLRKLFQMAYAFEQNTDYHKCKAQVG